MRNRTPVAIAIVAIVATCAVAAFVLIGGRARQSLSPAPDAQADPSTPDSTQDGAEEAQQQDEPVEEELVVGGLEFARFSMDGPEGWDQDYDDLSDTEGMVSISAPGSGTATMTVFSNTEDVDIESSFDLDNPGRNMVAYYLAEGTGEQVDVDGHMGCLQRQEYGDVCNYNLVWYVGKTLFTIDFSYPNSQEETYGEYARSFYQSIRMKA